MAGSVVNASQISLPRSKGGLARSLMIGMRCYAMLCYAVRCYSLGTGFVIMVCGDLRATRWMRQVSDGRRSMGIGYMSGGNGWEYAGTLQQMRKELRRDIESTVEKSTMENQMNKSKVWNMSCFPSWVYWCCLLVKSTWFGRSVHRSIGSSLPEKVPRDGTII